MTAASIRLTVRLHAFELIAFATALVALTIAGVWVAGLLDGTGYGRTCMAAMQAGLPSPAACERAGASFYDLQSRLVSPITGLLIVVALGTPALLGVLVVGRELERGTTRLAWSLAPSRWRWYAARLLPVLAIVAGLTFLAGIAMDRVIGAMEPGLDLSRSFAGFGGRGGLVASRAVFIFAIAILSGAMLGRTLPALMLATVLAYGGLAGGQYIHEKILTNEAVVVPEQEVDPGDRYIDQRFQMPDGSLVGWEAMYEIDPPPTDAEWIPKYPIVALIVPGDRYRFVELREAAALAGGSLVALALAGLVVLKRRPG